MKNLEILVSILDSSSSLTESEIVSLTRMIAEFQRDTGRTKRSRIDPGLQAFVDFLIPLFLLELALLKCRTKIARESSSSYDLSWLTDADKFPTTISRFEEITASLAMDSTIQHSISSAITSVVAAVMAFAQAKHKEDILALREMIEKALLLRESGSSTPPFDPNASSKLASLAELPTKSTER